MFAQKCFFYPHSKVPFRAIREKRWRKLKVKNWPFWGDLHPQGFKLFLTILAILAVFGRFLKKKTFSWFFRYYGMILLYIWVRFSHFPPLADFSSLPVICDQHWGLCGIRRNWTLEYVARIKSSGIWYFLHPCALTTRVRKFSAKRWNCKLGVESHMHQMQECKDRLDDIY